jgi:hypothetical protein
MPHYGDPIKQVGKSIAQTDQNAKAALRRAYPIVPKIERSRDIFDSIQAFEMFFDVERENYEVRVDFYFNKPPPVCSISGAKMCCDEFVMGPGQQLLQTTSPYIAGDTFVTINGIVQTRGVNYEERDPDNGIIWLAGLSVTTQYIAICYLRET